MRIASINISNFRSIHELKIPMSNFGCIIGENNAGKSSILQALDIFFSNPSVKESDFYDRKDQMRVEVRFEEIKDHDLARLSDEHRTRIAEHTVGGRLTLSRTYDGPGKGTMKLVRLMPKDRSYWPESVSEMTTGKSGEELRLAAVTQLPALAHLFGPKLSQKLVREKAAEFVAQMPDSEKVPADVPLVTGMEKSVTALLPEVIYIPAVKDLADELKTAESATFGKLLSILFQAIKPQLNDVEALFGSLHRYLNVTLADDGEVDQRLEPVVAVERVIEKNLQEAFPHTSLRIEIPPPDLRTVLSGAELTIDDGVRTAFKSKGDGLRRSVTFAILRAYAELRAETRIQEQATTPRPYLLLFEEPELFLHPRGQVQLFEALRVFAEENHVLVSTHSSAFFSPQTTGTFIKLIKDRTSTPPRARAFHVDLSDLRIKDQFQLVRQENNDVAFFCDTILLVEGDSDHITIPHLARTLNSEWDFTRRSCAVASISGKHSIQRYRSFFERFGINVAVLADLDAVTEGFDKLGASADATQLRDELMQDIGNLVAGSLTSETDLSSNDLRSIREAPTIKALWTEAKAKHDQFKADECTLEEVRAAVDGFFERVQTRDLRFSVMKELKDGPIAAKKAALLESLRAERIYILARGAIEDYYPRPTSKDKKLQAAQEFCDEFQDAAALRQLVGGGDDVHCEFDLIFRSFFGTPATNA